GRHRVPARRAPRLLPCLYLPQARQTASEGQGTTTGTRRRPVAADRVHSRRGPATFVRVAYVVRSWPRLTQTFILNEILALEQMGVAVSIFAMTRADEPVRQPQVTEVVAPVRYLDRSRGPVGAHLRVAASPRRRYAATLVLSLKARHLRGGYTCSSGVA